MFTIERWSLRIVARYEIIIGALGVLRDAIKYKSRPEGYLAI
jgi:hypothetical protein